MRILLVAFIFCNMLCYAQVDCKTAINFFPRIVAQAAPTEDGLKSEKIQHSDLQGQDLKAINRLEKLVKKQASVYASTLKIVKIFKVSRQTETIEYLVNFKLTFTDIEYRFNAKCDAKGKIKGRLELPSLKGKTILPACQMHQKAMQDPDLENVVGIRLIHEKEILVYEAFQEGEALHTEKDYRSDIMRNKKSKHKTVVYNAFNGEKIRTSTQEHVVIK